MGKRMNKTFFYGFVVSFLLFAVTFASAANEVIDFSLNKNLFAPNESMNITGKIFDSTSALGNTSITITLNGSEEIVVSDGNGSFNTTIHAPMSEGSYTINLTVGSTTVSSTIGVSTVQSLRLALLDSSSEELEVLVFTANNGSVGITNNGELDGNLLYTNFTHGSTAYFAILQKEDDETSYTDLFISEDKSFTTIDFQYLTQGSGVKLEDDDFNVLFIDPAGTYAFLGILQEPLFYGTGSETAKLFIAALNSSGSVILSASSVNLEHFNYLGNVLDINDDSASGDPIFLYKSIGGTNKYGFTDVDINIDSTGGMHHIMASGLGHLSYFVEKFTFSIGVETDDGEALSNPGAGDTVFFRATVVNTSDGLASANANIEAVVISPDGSINTLELEPDERNIYESNITLDAQVGEYLIIFSGEFGGASIKKEYRFKVQSYDLFMKAFSPGKGEGDAIPPNAIGYLIIGGRYLSNSSFIPLWNMTNGCNQALIDLTAIKDENGNNYLSTYTLMNLTQLFTATGAESWIQQEITENFGSGACAINFTTPSTTGSFKLNVDATISETTYDIFSYLDVVSLFVYGMPVSCTTGSWSHSLAPGAQVCFKVNAYNARTGQSIAAANLTDFSLIEVYADSDGVITKEITNFSIKNFSNGDRGFSMYTSSSSLGDHFVKFRVKANVSGNITKGLGSSFYRTELWAVFTSPYCGSGGNMGFCNFGASSTVQIKADAFSAGFSGAQEDLEVSVVSLRNFDTGETITLSGDEASDASCTTESDNSTSSQSANSSQSNSIVRPASCTLSINALDEGWDAGNYEVKLTASDGTASMNVYSWFKVENFRFWVWNRNWEMTAGQDGMFDVTVKDFNNQNIQADVSVTKIYFMGTGNKWMEPREVSIANLSALTQTITGSGTFVLNSSYFSGLSSGFYDIVFTATSSNGTQTARAGMNLRSFVVFVNNIGNNYDHSYEKGGDLVINVSGFSSINWTTWPPTGTARNITNVSVTNIRKNGMWDKSYKVRGRDAILESVNCSGNNCLYTLNLTNFEQSQYDLELEITDQDSGTSTTNYWFSVEQFSITVPEIWDWRTIPTSNKLTDKMMFELGTDMSCGTSQDSIVEPINVTSCLYDDSIRLPTLNEQSNQNESTIFLLDKTNVSNPKLYVNRYNNSWSGGNRAHQNFTLPSTLGPLIVGSNFTDTNGFRWNITDIDGFEGTVSLQFIDGVIRSRTKQAQGEGQTDNEVQYVVLYIINKSLSKSGIFLYTGSSDWEEKFWDDQWGNIDLDGDGKYNCPQGEACEEYIMLLADNAVSGVYDTLLLSQTRNMTAGITSIDGFPGNGIAGDLRFNISAAPIYLMNLIYSENNGVGRYRVVTTTNKAGWAGRNLGLFQVDSEHVKVPVMVASPTTKIGLVNKTVVIEKLRTFGTFTFTEYPLAEPIMLNTSENGIAMLDVNMSGIPSGEYSIIVQVNDNGEIVSSSNDWENPKVELRSFSISNLFGLRAQIDTIREWSIDAGNLFVERAGEAMVSGSGITKVRLQCGNWNNNFSSNNYCHAEDWRFKEIWVNKSNLSEMKVLKDITMFDRYLRAEDIYVTQYSIGGSLPVTSEFGGSVNYQITNISFDVQQTDLYNLGQEFPLQPYGMECWFMINITNITDVSFKWNVRQLCPWGDQQQGGWVIEQNNQIDIGWQRFLWDFLNVSSIDEIEQTVRFNRFDNYITLTSQVTGLSDRLEDGNDGRVRVVSNASGSGYDLYIYNDNEIKTRDDLENRSGMLDMIAVVNSSGSTVGWHRFGEVITEIGGNKAVVQANPWEPNVYFSNLTIGGDIIYPLPWACDAKKFYVGDFSEEELEFKMQESCGNNQEPVVLSSRTQYLLLFDSQCDGVSAITSGKIDDDPVLDDSYVRIPGCVEGPGTNCWIGYDYDHYEEGEAANNNCGGQQNSGNTTEQWIDLGRESWPLSVTDYRYLDNGNIDLFKVKWGVNDNENYTQLSLWVQAKNFDGTVINGSISVEKASGQRWECGISQEEDINVTTSDGEILNGIGYLDLDLSNITSTQPSITFKINDSNNVSNRLEFISKSFWFAPAMQNQDRDILGPEGGGGGGGDMCYYGKDGPMSGGGGDGFEMGPEELEQFMTCSNQTTNTTCGNSSCAWIVTETINADERQKLEEVIGRDINTPNICLPCPIFDGDQISCGTQASCHWVSIIQSVTSSTSTLFSDVQNNMGLCEPGAS